MKNLKAKIFRVKNLVSMTLITGFALLALTTACDDKIAPEKPKPEITTPPPQPPITPQPPVTKEAVIMFNNITLVKYLKKDLTMLKNYIADVAITDVYLEPEGKWNLSASDVPLIRSILENCFALSSKVKGRGDFCIYPVQLMSDRCSSDSLWFVSKGYTVNKRYHTNNNSTVTQQKQSVVNLAR